MIEFRQAVFFKYAIGDKVTVFGEEWEIVGLCLGKENSFSYQIQKGIDFKVVSENQILGAQDVLQEY